MNFSKILFFAGLFPISCATGVAAQDAMDWTGFYAGLGVGLQATHPDVKITNALIVINSNGPATKQSSAAVLDESSYGLSIPLSVIAGYGMQLDEGMYLGAEGELDVLGAALVAPASGVDCATVDMCATVDDRASLDTYARLRALVGGSPVPNLLVFGSAGVAFAQGSFGVTTVAYQNNQVVDSDADSATSFLIGATVGAGVDIKATSNLRIRLEGLVDLYPTAIPATLAANSAVDDGMGSSIDASITFDGSARLMDGLVRTSFLWQF